jgi:hypothetical protein
MKRNNSVGGLKMISVACYDVPVAPCCDIVTDGVKSDTGKVHIEDSVKICNLAAEVTSISSTMFIKGSSPVKPDIDPVLLSNPDLKFLGHAVAYEFRTHKGHLGRHKIEYLKSHPFATQYSVHLHSFDFDDPVDLKLRICDSGKPSTFSPFSEIGAQEVRLDWCKALKTVDYEKGKIVPLIIYVPRGDCSQVMTALLTLSRMPGFGSNSPKFGPQVIGISWIHST